MSNEPVKAPLHAGRAVQLNRLTQLSRAFTYATSLAEILELAVKQAAEMLGAKKAILFLADEQGILQVSASHGVDADVVERFRDSLDESVVTRIRGLVGAPMAHGFVGVPLVSSGQVTGMLAVLRPEIGIPTEDEEWLLSALADQISAPLENARLSEQLERLALISENGRLYEAECAARKEAELAREEAERSRLQAEAARELAESSNRSKSHFLAAMSHDLRTPLNAIAGYVELMRLGLHGPITEAQAADLDRIRTSQRHLLSIVCDVLEFAHIGAGRTVYNEAEVVVADALRNAEAMVMPQLLARRIEYRCDAPDGPVALRTDPDKLQQILLNLLSNAMKFTPEGGSMKTVIVKRTDGAYEGRPVVQISISDTGPGIPADLLDTIFLPFVQIDRALNHPKDGIGLGLAISRELARGQAGDVRAESVYGKGATFTLTLPVDPKGDVDGRAPAEPEAVISPPV